MTTGQAWQFRPYKWSEPKQLFHNGTLCLWSLPLTHRYRSDVSLPVKGFFVCWTNDPPNPKIKDWNVTELKVGLPSPFPTSFPVVRAIEGDTSSPPRLKPHITLPQIDPNRRHVDKSTVAQFWKILDDWMTANKPWMVVS